jgi:predicted nucleotidyltransferase
MKARRVAELDQLKPQERAALQEYLDRLQTRFAGRVLRVILYGSRARGEGDDESDLDVLVVVDDGDYDFHREVALESFEPSLAHEALISPMIWDRARYERQEKWGLLFFHNLEQDGVSLWMKAGRRPRSPRGLKGRKTTSKLRA